MKEADLYKPVIDYLNSIGCKAARNSTGMKGGYKYGLKRWPDIIGIDWTGVFIGIEVKKPGKKMSKEQEITLRDIRNRMAIGLCINNIDSVIKYFTNRMKKLQKLRKTLETT